MGRAAEPEHDDVLADIRRTEEGGSDVRRRADGDDVERVSVSCSRARSTRSSVAGLPSGVPSLGRYAVDHRTHHPKASGRYRRGRAGVPRDSLSSRRQDLLSARCGTAQRRSLRRRSQLPRGRTRSRTDRRFRCTRPCRGRSNRSRRWFKRIEPFAGSHRRKRRYVRCNDANRYETCQKPIGVSTSCCPPREGTAFVVDCPWIDYA